MTEERKAYCIFIIN